MIIASQLQVMQLAVKVMVLMLAGFASNKSAESAVLLTTKAKEVKQSQQLARKPQVR